MYQWHPKLVGQGLSQHIQVRQKNFLRKNPPKQKLVKATPLAEPNIVVVNPVEQPEDLDFPHPADQLPDLPLIEPNQPISTK